MQEPQQNNFSCLSSHPTQQEGKEECGGGKKGRGRSEDHGRGLGRGADPEAMTYLETLLKYEQRQLRIQHFVNKLEEGRDREAVNQQENVDENINLCHNKPNKRTFHQ